jgi:hypothetical protein
METTKEMFSHTFPIKTNEDSKKWTKTGSYRKMKLKEWNSVSEKYGLAI